MKKYKLDAINDVAEAFLKSVQPNARVFAFHGEMGAGKTTFIHALCRQLGVTGVMSSPSFALINEYETDRGETVYHIDLYRLQNSGEARRAGVEDCLYSGDYCMVEWPEKAPELLPEHTIHVYLQAEEDETRSLSIAGK